MHRFRGRRSLAKRLGLLNKEEYKLLWVTEFPQFEYSEEEDRYLLCRLYHYGMRTDDVYERIKKDITEFPVFRFDWFFKSRSPQELQRRCNTLLGMIEKEAEAKQAEEVKVKGTKGKVSLRLLPFATCTQILYRNVALKISRQRIMTSLEHPRQAVPQLRQARGLTRRRKHKLPSSTRARLLLLSLSSYVRISYTLPLVPL